MGSGFSLALHCGHRKKRQMAPGARFHAINKLGYFLKLFSVCMIE
jgi:hypothetical protein